MSIFASKAHLPTDPLILLSFGLYSTRGFNEGTDTKKDIYIGSAWPYANGLLHLGHLSGLIASDILARYFRAQGHRVLFVSGSDSHGTPVVIQAEKEGEKPHEIAEKYHKLLKASFEKLHFSYDIYTKTDTQNHKKTVQAIFLKLYEKGHIDKKIQILPYCENCKRFLPDRYVEGACPNCKFAGARGDQCDECGRLLDPDQLIGPKCKICKKAPVWRETEHFFLKLSDFEKELIGWIEKSDGWRENAKQFSLSFLRQGLNDRPITRDIEWGIPVPIRGYEAKKIYVWFEAVCGYYSACFEWAKTAKQKKFIKNLWNKNDRSLHYYTHGKDNIVFHSIIWPAILIGSYNLHLPDYIVSSEYLTIEKKQFSKSRNWAIYVDNFLKKFEVDTIRYYLAAYGPETSDADFSWDDFQERVNKELIGNFANFIHRTLSLIKNDFSGEIEYKESKSVIVKKAQDAFYKAGKLIERARIREALREVVGLAEAGNKYLSETRPWEKSVGKDKAAKVLAECAYVIECLGILAAPFLPEGAQKIGKCLNTDINNWILPKSKVYNISDVKPIYRRVEDEEIKAEIAKLTDKQ